MLDIHFIREHSDIVKAGAAKKHIEVDIDGLLKLDDERRSLQQKVDDRRSEQNKISDQIPKLEGGEREVKIAESKLLKDKLQEDEKKLKEVLKQWRALMVQVPNIPDMSVPEGKEDSDNKEIRTWGEKKEFSFTPKSHVELMQKLGMVDLERGAKVSGFRGYFLKGDGARLNFALWQFAMNFFNEKDFTPVITPSLVRGESFFGTGYLPQSEEDLYKTQDDSYLAGTSEVAAMGMHANEMLDVKELPKKYFAFSPCFRREAGSHGKDTKGLVRVHEFFKFEQVVLSEASHEKSVEYHEELTKNAEDMMRALKLPYHVVVNCGGDLGLGQVKKYDIEAWVPTEDAYRETHSASYFHDFQTRRLGIRYRDENGDIKFAHSLNNTFMATPRLLVPIIENYQNEDGSITVPEVLIPYMGKDVIT
ncbi:serine--tRNA ligase [Candidatus Wolfebacteria bacterium]|nr:serine--tRNA ligase [Candidatus Wolfebacteria bacterium]